MILAIEFEGAIVAITHKWSPQLKEDFLLLPGVKNSLECLRQAKHTLILYSSRACISIKYSDILTSPTGTSQAAVLNKNIYAGMQSLYKERFDNMVEFIEKHLPGLFDVIDDGNYNKNTADIIIDNRLLCAGGRSVNDGWGFVTATYGDDYNA